MRKMFVILLVLLTTASCRRGQPDNQAAQSPSPPPPVICPYTGEVTARTFDPAKAPIAVKVDNAPAARPHFGLDKADVVYEEIAEGGITRFLAIFHCREAPLIGPVRSARLVDPDILLEYAPVTFGYSGAAGIVESKVQSTAGVAGRPERTNGGAYGRISGRLAPHNFSVSTATLRGLSNGKGSHESGLVFNTKLDLAPPKPDPSASPGATPTEPPGKAISFSFSGSGEVRWLFNSVSGEYLRFHDEAPHNLAPSGQVSAKNVIVLTVQVRAGTIRDAAGNVSPEIVVVGQGDAVVLRGGVAARGTWKRANLAGKTRLLDAAGKNIELLPGSTWIHLLPAGRPVEVS